MSIRDEALAAHRDAQERVAATVAELEQDQRQRQDEEARHVLGLVRESVLAEWFPLAEWEVYATASSDHSHGMRGYPTGGRFSVTQLVGIVCADRPGGTDPEWAGVPCFGISDPGPRDEIPDGGERFSPGVFYCHTRHDEGYTRWAGVEVRTLWELGAWIAKWEQTDKGKAAAARATALTANELRAVSLSGSDQRPFCPPNGGRCDHMPGTCTEGCLRERTRTTGREAVSLADLDVTGKVLEGPPDRVAEELKQGYVQVSRNWEEYIAVTEPMRAGLAGAGEALCPETDGMCEHASECRKPRGCWLRHARIAGEPEGRTTGLHRDSMG